MPRAERLTGPGGSVLVFDPVVDVGAVFAAIAAPHRARLDAGTTLQLTWLDTADWRLARAGAWLRAEQRGTRRELVLGSDGVRLRTALGRARWPGRPDALAPSELRSRLTTLVGARAILPLATVEAREFPVTLLDELDKTRARGTFAQSRLITPTVSPLAPRLELAALRGYQRDVDTVLDQLRRALPAPPDTRSAADEALLAAGHRVGHYAGQGPVALDPAESGGTGVARILLDHLDVILANRDAAATGADSESLHDLRVALRSSRALLKDVGDLLPNDLAGRFGPDLAWLARATTRARDLDTALETLSGNGSLRVDGIDGLAPVQDSISRRRTAAIRALARDLHGERADAPLHAWRAALEHVVEVDPPGATIAEVARVRIKAAYRELVRAFADLAAGPGEPDLSAVAAPRLHGVRKRTKAVRYLVQATRSLADPAADERLVGTLKTLQDQLGLVQDATQLRAELAGLVPALARRHGDADALLAVGALQDRIAAQEQAVRAALPRTVRQLGSGKTRRAVDTLIAADKPADKDADR